MLRKIIGLHYDVMRNITGLHYDVMRNIMGLRYDLWNIDLHYDCEAVMKNTMDQTLVVTLPGYYDSGIIGETVVD